MEKSNGILIEFLACTCQSVAHGFYSWEAMVVKQAMDDDGGIQGSEYADASSLLLEASTTIIL